MYSVYKYAFVTTNLTISYKISVNYMTESVLLIHPIDQHDFFSA